MTNITHLLDNGQLFHKFGDWAAIDTPIIWEGGTFAGPIGSRVGLMVATVQYIDEAVGFLTRTQHVRDEEDSVKAIGLFLALWADYVTSV